MRSHSYLNTAKKIIESFDGTVPFANWIKQFFKADKKYGSKDRKEISHACYCFYRLGNSFSNVNFEERILIALFLCSAQSNKIIEELKPEWKSLVGSLIEEKIKFLSAENEIKNVFPFEDELSSEINAFVFNLSFLIQPDLFLRIRPGKKEIVLQKLNDASIPFSLISEECIRLSNQVKIDEVLKLDEEVVVQDLNSQKTIDLIENSKFKTQNPKLSSWDCCAASGGKSILLHDHFPDVRLTVSDVRESILINLQKRFVRAGIKCYNFFVADVSSPNFSIQNKFDIVVCDVPCSGSGTWSRTPEQLSFFNKEKIDHYSSLQKKIVSNAAKAISKNGCLLYITCSVFKKENEEVVEFIKSNLSLKLIAMKYLKGYNQKADTLFAALFSL